MEWQKVVAIVRRDALEPVEARLVRLGVKGISVSTVKGFGEYANFFTHDWFVTHVRIEIFTEAARAREIAEAIMSAAQTGAEGDGIVAVLPVAEMYRIRECRPCRPGEL